MGLATLDGVPFRLDPTSASWDFSIKTNVINTVGGRVVQVIGVDLGDMMVVGTFGVGGWREQQAFLERMKQVGERQVNHPEAPPMRFLYPPRGWDFLVYLRSYTQPASPSGGDSVYVANEIIAPQWALTLFMVEDNAGLKKVAQDAYIARIAAGLGWKQTKYNGPMTADEVHATLGGLSITDYLAKQFGFAQNASTP
jgi:hypothetical protein